MGRRACIGRDVSAWGGAIQSSTTATSMPELLIAVS